MNTLAKGFLFHDGPPAAGLVVCPEWKFDLGNETYLKVLLIYQKSIGLATNIPFLLVWDFDPQVELHDATSNARVGNTAIHPCVRLYSHAEIATILLDRGLFLTSATFVAKAVETFY
jgi:hypothetical protein